jgi:hypothetical protein
MALIVFLSTLPTTMNRPRHVERERNKAKFWLDPVRLQSSGRYNRNEINRIHRLIEENQGMLLEKWNDYFSD